MTVVSVKEISKDFGIKPLFSSLTFVLQPNECVALIGNNGCGKSTLLRMIAGFDDPDSGEIVRRRDLYYAYCAQQDNFVSDRSIIEVAKERLAHTTVSEYDIQQVLNEAGFGSLDSPASLLSGGWQKRLSLICALTSCSDLLLLDEPTNHLDLPGILWLEEKMQNFKGAILFVSHDRYFVERLAQKTVELNASYPGGYITADGGYSDLLEKRENVLNTLRTHRQSLENKVRREVAWLRQGVKARTTKAKYRIDEAHRLINELNSIQHNQSAVDLGFAATGRKTKELLKADKLSCGYEDKTLCSDLSFVLYPGSRLGIVGANGCGKSTLLKTLIGELPPLKGKVVRASNLKINFFGQMREQLNPDLTLKDALSPDSDSVVYQDRSIHVVTWARRFLFKTDQLSLKLGELSGGEQARLLLAKVSLLDADVLVFDEPTNDLDIQTLEVLEQSFIDFPGALVVVSHDRHLLDRTCTAILGFLKNGEVIQCADYTQYEITWLEQREASGKAPSEKSQSKLVGLSFQEQKELQSLERRIATLEKKKKEFAESMHNPEFATDPEKLQTLHEQLAQTALDLDALFIRWSELEDKKV